MAELIPVAITKAGLADLNSAISTAAAAAGDSVPAANGLLIAFKNGQGSDMLVTVARPSATVGTGRFGDAALSDLTLTVADGDIGLLTIPPGYANASGDFAWTYDDETSVTVAVYSLAP